MNNDGAHASTTTVHSPAGRVRADAWGAALLGRPPLAEAHSAASRLLLGSRVLVTGAAGSIGSELARQATADGAEVFMLDYDESRLHALQLELSGSGLLDDPRVVLADIRDDRRIRQVMRQVQPEIVFHAAAHKHLPLLERYPSEGVKTNVAGTGHVLDAAIDHGVDRFILVSTDKAADPSSVLGATKRLAEQIVSSSAGLGTRVGSVRFGNVLASRGSLLDTLQHQIVNGLPVSVTDPLVERYFMTIPEAVSLVIEASLMASHGETFVLDMGQPVRIVDIVRRFADLLGADQPEISFVGLRPGEKLSEGLFCGDEVREPTANRRVWQTHPTRPSSAALELLLGSLIAAASEADDERVMTLLPLSSPARATHVAEPVAEPVAA